jgi:hypothetical protein
MLAWGFTRLKSEHCIYLRRTTVGILLITIHIDDFFTVSSTKQALCNFKAQLRTKWQVAELGDTHFCLGIAIERDHNGRTISLSQTTLIDHIITQFGLKDAVTCTVPMEPGLRLSCRDHSLRNDTECDLMARTPYRSLLIQISPMLCNSFANS